LLPSLYTPSLHDALPIFNMPGMSGLDLFPRIKSEHPTLPVLMITAYGDANTRRVAFERGADGLLTKPIDSHPTGVGVAVSRDHEDRKSTRLNSSHLGISY